MAPVDVRIEADLAGVTRDVEAALGDQLVSLTLYGSAAGDDWVAGRSDLNVAIVVRQVSLAVLEALAPVVARWRGHGVALPLVVDREYLAAARDAFPMELDDIRRARRVLAGTDAFADVRVEPRAVRLECEREARGKLLRLRAHFLETVGSPAALEHLMTASLKSFLVVLRHLLRLRGDARTHAYADVLAAGERLLGPLPVMRRLLEHRTGPPRRRAPAWCAEFGAYLAEVERVVEALDALDG